MKFKYLIIAFSIIIVIVILVTVLLPTILSETDILVSFRFITFPLLILVAVLLVLMSLFFFLNYRLFSLLEREDWPALAYYLEQKIYSKRKYTDRNVRLLASSYLVISDFSSVINLESKTQLAKPALVSQNVLIFGAARILSGAYAEAAAFFMKHMKKCRKTDSQWVHWYYGFSNLLAGNFLVTEPEFITLAESCDDAVITGLSAYFLYSSLEKKSQNREICRQASEKGRERVTRAFKNPESWKKETDKMKSDIHAAIIRKYIETTGIWLFAETNE